MPIADPDQRREYGRKWMAARRARFMPGDKCVRCGSRENLELDHIDPDRKVDHRVWSWSTSRLLAEVEKCQVLCRECHQHKTTAQTYLPRRHGTRTMYRHGGCRCTECKRANAEYARVLRARRASRPV